LPAESSPLSPGGVEELQRYLVRRKRRAFFSSLPLLLLAALAFAAAMIKPRQFGSLAFFAAVIVALVGQSGYEWWTLRGADPMQLSEPERHAAARRQAELLAHEALSAQVRPYATFALTGTIAAVAAVQFLVTPASRWVQAGALLDPPGEWWRILTASFMHGSVMHLIANLGVLLMLGRFIEIYNRRLRVPLIYLASVVGGGLLSTLTFPQTGVGASGGILGLAGYLVVVAGRPNGGTPVWIRRRMLSILGMTALTATAAFFFIDNAAHAGGTVAGALLGLALPSAQPSDPFDGVDALGLISAFVLAAGAVFTIIRLLAAAS
jgi:membrane associated rhomboid family serine protease